MLKKGDLVVMHTCPEASMEKFAGKIWTCRSDEQPAYHEGGNTVVFLVGFSGSFAVEFLQKVELPNMEYTANGEPKPIVYTTSKVNVGTDLETLVHQSFKEVVASGFIANKIKSRLENTISELIDDTLKSYSDFGKSLKGVIADKFHIDPKQFNLPEYNTLVAHIVSEQLDKLAQTEGVVKLKDYMNILLGDMKPEYKLSELLKEWAEEKNSDGDKDDEEFTLIVERRREGIESPFWFYFDEEEGKDKHGCGISCMVHKGKISCLNVEGRKVDSKSMMGYGFNDFDGVLMKLYMHGCKLIVDEDDIETYYPNLHDN